MILNTDLVSPLSTFLGYPGFRISIRLLPSSCLSLYGNQSAQPLYDQWAVSAKLQNNLVWPIKVKLQPIPLYRDNTFQFKQDFLGLFLHNSYGTTGFLDCGNLMGADSMGNLRQANTEPSMHFRETITDPSMHFRKANTDPSMYFRKANTEFLLPVLLPSLLTISLLTLFPFYWQFYSQHNY